MRVYIIRGPKNKIKKRNCNGNIYQHNNNSNNNTNNSKNIFIRG